MLRCKLNYTSFIFPIVYLPTKRLGYYIKTVFHKVDMEPKRLKTNRRQNSP